MAVVAVVDAADQNADESIRVEILGLNVHALAKVTDQSLEVVGQITDIPYRVILKWKEGEGTIQENRLKALANLFGIGDEQLLLRDFDDDNDRVPFWRKTLGQQVPVIGQCSKVLSPAEGSPEGGVDVSGPSAMSTEALLECEPEWDADQLTCQLGDRTFDFSQLEVRSRLVSHIRAALSRAGSNIRALVDAEIVPNQRFLDQVGRGNVELTSEQVTQIAGHCNVSVPTLLLGHGLSDYLPKPKGVAKPKAGQIGIVHEIPAMSAADYQAHFRELVMADGVEFVGGFNPMSLVRQISSGGAEPNWDQIWLERTGDGRQYMDKIIKPLLQSLQVEELAMQILLVNTALAQLAASSNES